MVSDIYCEVNAGVDLLEYAISILCTILLINTKCYYHSSKNPCKPYSSYEIRG